MKSRVRFGIRLSWPIANAATLVRYMDSQQAIKLQLAFAEVQRQLTQAGQADIAARIICEVDET